MVKRGRIKKGGCLEKGALSKTVAMFLQDKLVFYTHFIPYYHDARITQFDAMIKLYDAIDCNIM